MNPKAEAITRRLTDAAQPVADQLGLEVVEIVFVDARKRPTVRVYVDKDGGVSLADCAQMSRGLGEVLEAGELIPGQYNLEVSSPGAERPFSSLRQYQRNVHKTVEVVLQESDGTSPLSGMSHLRGTLLEVAEDRIVVQTEKGPPVEIPMSRIKRANRVVTF